MYFLLPARLLEGKYNKMKSMQIIKTVNLA